MTAFILPSIRLHLSSFLPLNWLCLCDSRGQHKLPRERKRLGIEDAKAVEVTAPTPAPTPKQEEVNDYSIF